MLAQVRSVGGVGQAAGRLCSHVAMRIVLHGFQNKSETHRSHGSASLYSSPDIRDTKQLISGSGFRLLFT
jgi:hypothetical protein